MEWMKWLIPAIAVAVWILSRLAAQQQNQRRVVPPPRPFPPDPDDEPRGRRASAELERFLEEVKRRKEAEENAPVEPILIAEEVPARRSGPPPLPRPVEQRPEQRRKSIAVGRSSKRRDDPVMVLQPIADPPLPSRTVAMPSSVPATVQPTQALPPPPTAPQAPQAIHRPEALPTQRAATPTMKLVRELLKNRQTLATAFLLREVFDRPRCRRPHHRPA